MNHIHADEQDEIKVLKEKVKHIEAGLATIHQVFQLQHKILDEIIHNETR